LILGTPFFIAYKAGKEIWPMAVVAVLASIGPFLYSHISKRAEDAMLKEQRRYQQALIQISKTMILIKELDHLLDLIVQKVKTLVGIKDVCLFVDDKTGQYVLKTMGHENGFPKDLRFPSKDPIIKYLAEHRSPIIREEILAGKSQKGRESDLEAISSLMQRYGIALIIPSFVQDSLLGFMTLGEKSDGRMYTQDDLNVFEALANQAALAIENAVFYEEQGKSLAQELQEHKLKYLGNMASNMCHDLNNRFNGIVIQTFEIFDAIIPAIKEFFKTHSDDEALETLLERLIKNLKIVEHHAMAGGETVERFRQQSRQAKIEVLSLASLIENSLLLVTYPKDKTGDVAKIIPREEYGLEIKIPDGFPKLSGEVFSLENAIGNMLRNACAAQEKKKESIKKGELKIGSYSPKVTISAHTADSMAVITIQDNGIGMTKDELGQMFVPFFTTKVKGTGLGLSILKTMIELQGGKVSVESEYTKGTTFTISLPQAKEGGTHV
jgi:signal transduction histidine kinase